MLTITEVSDGYRVTFNYKPWIIEAIKKIPGARWNGEFKYWHVPQSSKNQLLNWNKNLGGSATPKKLAPGPIEPMPELTVPINLKKEMFHYQGQGVAYNLIHEKSIIADEPGLGKTVQAIATVEAAKCKLILVICPNTLKNNWKDEIENKWTNRKALILSDKVKKTWPTYYQVGMINYIIVNYESLKKYFVDNIRVYYDDVVDEHTGQITKVKKPLRLNHIDFNATLGLIDAVIFDEGHRCRDGSTQQSKFVMGICRGKKHVFDLTGTPFVNKPKDLISQLHILEKLNLFGGYKGFVEAYCQGANEASNLAHLNYMLNKHCFYRRLKKDVLKDLPEKRRSIVKCDISTRDEYNKAEKNLKNWLAENTDKSAEEIAKTMRGEVMVLFGILKRISARGKIEQVLEYIRDVNAAGEKMVMFAWHKEIIADLKAQLPGAVTIVGDNSLDERHAAVYSFQKCGVCGVKKEDHQDADHDHVLSDTQNILLNIKSGGVGITLTASSRVGHIELPWTGTDLTQDEDRCHRIGQLDGVESIMFIGEGTVDEDILDIIEGKIKIAAQITGDADEDFVSETSSLAELINRFKSKLD